MEYYAKGKNVEESFTRENIPIPNLPCDFLWMQVNAGSKIRNLLTLALKEYKDIGTMVWTGSGAGLGKTITCAEIVKKNFKMSHQITKICYQKVEEHWEPKTDTLEPLVVLREIPVIHILLSMKPLNTQEPGYQPPGSIDVFWKEKIEKRPKVEPSRNTMSTSHFTEIGLQSAKVNKQNQYFKSRINDDQTKQRESK